MGNDREDFDNLVWDRNDEAWAESQKQLRYKTTCRLTESLVEQKFGRKPATLISPLIIGGYNTLYRIRFEGVSPDVMVRLPCPSLIQFPVEKTFREAVTARYIGQNTQIPVPQVFYHGQDSVLGPFIILQHVENRDTLSDALTINKDDLDEPHVLNPNISDTTLENHYVKVACCLLQLAQPSFPRIGSLVESDDGSSYSVAGRPITLNMNNMLQLANIPPAVLPPEGKTYETADEWYVALSEMHIAQLVFQHNDLVSTKDDCRNKYVARQLFRKLAKQGRLSTFGFAEDSWSAQSKTAQSKAQPSTLSPAPAQSGSFRLWCDDFRAGNILLNESDDIAAVIDWEFAYVGPTQFVLDPPWWLLLELPEMWSSGIDDWRNVYDIRLNIWLSAMKQAEKSMGSSSMPCPLSVYMRESWETGRFWLNYAARKSWAFDAIFWKYLDGRFFGERGSAISKDELWKTRVHLLGEEERGAMETFVETKMEKSKERIIVDWDPKEAKEYLAQVLFD